MVSVHSTYVHDNSHGHHHHQKSCQKQRKQKVIKDNEFLTRTSYVRASYAHREIKKVNK